MAERLQKSHPSHLKLRHLSFDTMKHLQLTSITSKADKTALGSTRNRKQNFTNTKSIIHLLANVTVKQFVHNKHQCQSCHILSIQQVKLSCWNIDFHCYQITWWKLPPTMTGNITVVSFTNAYAKRTISLKRTRF